MEIMQGKRCLITGANSGIGKETAKALAQMGAEVIMVCRNAEKGQVALTESAEVEGQTGLYFSAKKPKASSPNSYDQPAGEKLVQQSRVLLETVWARA
jgi:NAD(P)-dependent dehydrogenase (short-subunit alcohol dehydrogenase family)